MNTIKTAIAVGAGTAAVIGGLFAKRICKQRNIAMWKAVNEDPESLPQIMKRTMAAHHAAAPVVEVDENVSIEPMDVPDSVIDLTKSTEEDVRPVKREDTPDQEPLSLRREDVQVISRGKPVIPQVVFDDTSVRSFLDFFDDLSKQNAFIEFDQSWGSSKKGFKGLIKANPLPGFRCSYSEVEQVRVIYHADSRGKIVAVYENGQGDITYTAHPDVEVKFDSVLLSEEDLELFRNNQYRL